jgi:hypothetical protein
MRYGMILAILLSGCTAADRAQIFAYGTPGHIKCYSGGQLIYEGGSVGKISAEDQSSGWYFQEKQTGRLMRVSGDCVITN